jgi:DNA invertase Pin-like site-specific DNA recombinase
MAKGRFISYLRVSTQRQGADGLGVAAQRAAVVRWLDGGPWTLLAEFVEVESGKSDKNRPQLAAALAACRIRKATLVISRLDRLSRDAHFLLGLEKAGVDFIAVDMPHANRLTIGIMAMVADEERRAISARTKAALAAARERGVALGGWRGSIPSDEARMASTAALKARAAAFAADLGPVIAELREAGVTSLNAIANALTERGIETPRGGSTWTATSVKRVLAHLEDREPARVL